MKFGIFSNYGALNSKPVFEALTTAIKRNGWQAISHDENADVAVIWSVLWDGRMKANRLIWEKYKRHKRPVLILEVGALDRGNLWKVSIGGINGSGYFGPKNNDDSRRKKLNIKIKDWKEGDNIILCGQHPASQQWEGMPPMHIWLSETIARIRKHTDRKIIVRPHPRAKYLPVGNFKNVEIKPPCHMIGTYDSFDFEQTLENAWAVVNWNSNPASIAALNGVPVFVGPDSLAMPVGNINLEDIESPATPNREQWVNDLACTEWSLEEISSGEPLARLSEKLTSIV